MLKDVWYEKNQTSCWRNDSSFYIDCNCYAAEKGFENKPTLFLLLGGFSFKLTEDRKIVGEDLYDWNPTLAGDFQHLAMPECVHTICKMLEKIFPYEWFYEGGVSSKFFNDLEEVGAKPFYSKFEYKGLVCEEIDRALKMNDEEFELLQSKSFSKKRKTKKEAVNAINSHRERIKGLNRGSRPRRR